MVKTASTMLPLGTKAPEFTLPDATGRVMHSSDFNEERGLLVMFICNHCPYVKLLRGAIAELGREYQQKCVSVVAIMPNDAENYPDDRPEKMVDEIMAWGYTFPYLYDETQAVAQAYRAACTPDFFLFDADRRLYYRGQFDDARPGNGVEVTGRDLRHALERLLAGEPAPEDQKPSLGCNIKWKPGNAPDYFG
ncbi:MAG: thioredoxin family protein [Candidatus Hydrogenedentes bacterium]|nr:thioredoxin family protein [Candidatus Hydrogenedentota bacterium]